MTGIIESIYKATEEKRAKYGSDVAINIVMHPSVYEDCMHDKYADVVSVFDLRLCKLKPETMFGYSLTVDFDLDENEWRLR